MKLKKILISVLTVLGTTIPIVLSSCSEFTTSNQKIAAPFHDSLYDAILGNDIYFYSDNNAITSKYEIQDINQWKEEELKNGRNYNVIKNTSPDDSTNSYYESFICTYFDKTYTSTNTDILFKDLNSFYTWIKKDQNSYKFYLNGDISLKEKIFTFETFDWNFLINPYCNVYIYIQSSSYLESDNTLQRNIDFIKITTTPKQGFEWDINRNDTGKNYNNNKFIEFLFSFSSNTNTF